MRHTPIACAAITAAALLAGAGAAEAAPKRLPTFEVTSAGAGAAQAERLAQALRIDAELREADGALRFLDRERFGALPTTPLPAPPPDEEGTPVIAAAPDLDAIRAIDALPGDTARRRAVRALRRAGLAFRGKGVVGHSQFDSVDANGRPNAHVDVDTHVSFPAKLAGRPLIGAGEKAKVVFAPDGRPSYLRYAHRKLEQAGDAALLRGAAADRLAVRRFTTGCPGDPAVTGLELDRRLVYHAPSLALGSVERILPHYDYGATARIGGQTVQLQRVLVPAVRRGAPKVALKATADGARVTAAATVRGGTAPYTYRYGSCATTLPDDAAAAGPSTAYTVTERPESPGPVDERVTVTVTDANGLEATAAVDVDVTQPAAARRAPARLAVANRIDVATEGIGNSQGLPNTASNTAGFRGEMDDVATIGFSWADDDVFESDFVDPTDASWADNVDLMWFQGHGNRDGFATGDRQGDGFVHRDEATWGNTDLEWLVAHSCSVLELGSGATSVWNRWEPAFARLHLMLGYGNSSYNVNGDGQDFGDDLADDGMRLRDAWIDANEDEQPNGVIYRYLGVYGPSGEWNRDDFFHGKGAVSGDISTVTGAWSYSGTV